ncbi:MULTISPECIES: glycosyltransferase family 4 protein [unclassified Enterococcus]|uniref:glycosyltransferase family 4 protein n=1 Tax=unclassified Enterococcus TaxID=2608891 RepID=UPI001CE15A46|nr:MULTISPECIES: glycosyltransferase family 4 protein [unclassified Enterococcus]MCA5014446.1 glycosyltransferase family 4 protein [Enterococcus sp. S23]MCA5017440.1 glycosyltransferase family 4 protein [Enterococcus sp. S22(2020)]
MKKVMMYSSIHPWKDARIFFKEAQSLSKEYEVDFYAVGTQEDSQKYAADRLHLFLHQLAGRSGRFRLWRKLYQNVLKSDAVFYHFHDPELLLLAPFIKRNKKQAILIYDMHENFPKSLKSKKWLPKWLRPIMAKYAKVVERQLLKKVNGVIFAEKSYKSYYPDIIAEGKSIDIYNYPLMKDKELPTVLFAHSNVLKLVYIGRISEIRGIWEMLQAVKVLSETRAVHLTLAGGIDEGLKKDIEKYIAQQHMTQLVTLHSYIEYAEIWTVYRESDIGLCLLHPVPNYQESLATKMFEYMASGLPMIISNFPLWQQFVNENQCGLTCDPQDVQEIIEKIEQLANSPETRTKYGRHSQQQFREKYNWHVEETKLLSFYRELEDKVIEQ